MIKQIGTLNIEIERRKIKNKNISLDQLYTIIDNLQSDIQGETI